MYINNIFRTIVLIFVTILSQRFSRTLQPSSGGWNVEFNPLFRLQG